MSSSSPNRDEHKNKHMFEITNQMIPYIWFIFMLNLGKYTKTSEKNPARTNTELLGITGFPQSLSSIGGAKTTWCLGKN